jgi:hypothetical protein
MKSVKTYKKKYKFVGTYIQNLDRGEFAALNPWRRDCSAECKTTATTRATRAGSPSTECPRPTEYSTGAVLLVLQSQDRGKKTNKKHINKI